MEIYKGTKFKTLLTDYPNSYSEEVELLKYWCQFYSLFRLAPRHESGSFGNLSFRNSKNEIFITKTGLDLGSEISNEDFIKIENCDFEAFTLYANGKFNPSSESMLHYFIYEKRADVNAIFHGHNDSFCNKVIEKGFPETIEETPYGTIELVESVIPLINNDIFVIKNHGFVITAKSIETAGLTTKSILNLIQNTSL
ncbi:MAG: class II aldolase/adducin family protein [Bacteroidales bacterium]|nr:class II aldolase/adducin family protein [Bacteroidales bacterium]